MTQRNNSSHTVNVYSGNIFTSLIVCGIYSLSDERKISYNSFFTYPFYSIWTNWCYNWSADVDFVNNIYFTVISVILLQCLFRIIWTRTFHFLVCALIRGSYQWKKCLSCNNNKTHTELEQIFTTDMKFTSLFSYCT